MSISASSAAVAKARDLEFATSSQATPSNGGTELKEMKYQNKSFAESIYSLAFAESSYSLSVEVRALTDIEIIKEESHIALCTHLNIILHEIHKAREESSEKDKYKRGEEFIQNIINTKQFRSSIEKRYSVICLLEANNLGEIDRANFYIRCLLTSGLSGTVWGLKEIQERIENALDRGERYFPRVDQTGHIGFASHAAALSLLQKYSP